MHPAHRNVVLLAATLSALLAAAGTAGAATPAVTAQAQAADAGFLAAEVPVSAHRRARGDGAEMLREGDPRRAPGAEMAFDPFHVVSLAQRAVDQVRCNPDERSHTPTAEWIKGTRWSLLTREAPAQRALLSSRAGACAPARRDASSVALGRVPSG
jgi:hypothetical protein